MPPCRELRESMPRMHAEMRVVREGTRALREAARESEHQHTREVEEQTGLDEAEQSHLDDTSEVPEP